MTQEDRIIGLVNLGEYLQKLSEAEKEQILTLATSKNAWFTHANISLAINGVIQLLQKDKLTAWVSHYPSPSKSLSVGIIMAGNIPMVGFHDLLCVLITGNKAIIKLSSQDNVLPSFLINALIQIDKRFAEFVDIVEKLPQVDAVIATGSDNSSRYFKKYFGCRPNIIRQNRTSVAIISGEETDEELELLGNDIFTYFGMGCRNVSKLYVPKGYKFEKLIPHFDKQQDIINHPKYFNNYEYNKAIYLVNRVEHLDNGFMLFRKTPDMVSPLAVVYYEEYALLENLMVMIDSNLEKLQCIVSRNSVEPATVAFGDTQSPNLDDYADNVDTMAFLAGL